jgi:hypothetical protein
VFRHEVLDLSSANLPNAAFVYFHKMGGCCRPSHLNFVLGVANDICECCGSAQTEYGQYRKKRRPHSGISRGSKNTVNWPIVKMNVDG